MNDGHTVPRWRGVYALDIYLAMADGVWRYEPNSPRIVFHMPGDLRAQTTTGQPFVATAPLDLVYALDMSKLSGTSESEGIAAAAACVAMVGQNVYLYCAAEGLATVFRQSVLGEEACPDADASAAADHPIRADGRIPEDLENSSGRRRPLAMPKFGRRFVRAAPVLLPHDAERGCGRRRG